MSRPGTIAAVLLSAITLMGADLPVRQVVLYKHGIGFFERSGTLGAGETARLDFKPGEMNDVLKSLTINEKGGGKISGLRYDSSIPLEQKLADFPFALKDHQPLSAVLDQLKGARVELQFGNDKVSGIIVAARNVAGDKDRGEREQITLLLDSGDLKTFDLSAATSIRFTDPKLQIQFKDYLTALTNARSKDKRSVYIDSTDSKSREVTASYIIPTPIWKSSYRLIFGDSGQPTLEGWAIVDNTTGEDWTHVRMALVSGKPISFISQLYEPRYIRRQVAELAEEVPVAPTVHSGALDSRQFSRLSKSAQAPPGAAGMADAVAVMASDIADPATGKELGELFEYTIPSPVTVRKDESAMLPFLQQKIGARKLLIYSDGSSQHPLNAAELTNSTGKTLDGGPITVFDAGAYAGEALVETVKGGDKRLISYGVDLGTRVTTNIDSSREITREIHLSRGLLTIKLAAAETKTYTIFNADQKAKTLIIEHPLRPQYHLMNQKPLETTANAYRFEVKLGPGATEKFPVTEERVYDNSISLTNLTPDSLGFYLQNKNLGDSARKQLQQILDVKRQMATLDAEARANETQINNLTRDQERVRQNISSLNQVSGQQQQVQTYAKQLAAQEAQLATLRDRQAEIQRKRADLQSQLNALIEKMEF